MGSLELITVELFSEQSFNIYRINNNFFCFARNILFALDSVTEDDIMTHATVDSIVTGTTEETVVATFAINGIVTGTAINTVIASTTVNHIVTSTTDNYIVTTINTDIGTGSFNNVTIKA